MNKLLLSIKPEYAEKIFNGTKRFEFRKKIWNNHNIDTVVVYASAPVKKVIGEFKIGDTHHLNIYIMWDCFKEFAGISERKFLDYFDKEDGYAIEVEAPTLYEIPKTLANFDIKTPPQNFCYIK
jgi:predicted transcriptional regulator